jgi:predicted nucleic acid-binding Zn ribbon protein
MKCEICGNRADVVCGTVTGDPVTICYECAKELGRLWLQQRGG